MVILIGSARQVWLFLKNRSTQRQKEPVKFGIQRVKGELAAGIKLNRQEPIAGGILRNSKRAAKFQLLREPADPTPLAFERFHLLLFALVI
jgi:hypothetical protein